MAQPRLKAAILIVSDTAAADPRTDECAPVLRDVLRQNEWDIAVTHILADEEEAIQRFVTRWTDGEDWANCILTSGGTGFATKDITPEAVTPLLDKQAPGLVHAMLTYGLQITPFAMMARPVAGVRGKSVIVTLPGSPKGARENLEAIIKLLPHACRQTAGGNSRTIHTAGVAGLEREAGLTPQGQAPASGSVHFQSHTNSHGHSHSHTHGGHKVPRAHTRPEERPVPNDPSAGPANRHRESPYPMITVEEALALIKEFSLTPSTERRPVDSNIVGCVLAEDVIAPESVPAFRASTVDGYAICVPASGKFEKATYPVAFVSVAQAGKVHKLEEGQIARITTGAPLPRGSNAVVMVEDTVVKSFTSDRKEEREVEILTSEIEKGENVREVGSDVKQGTIIMHKGEGVSAVGGELGLLASVGVQNVLVYKKPIVGVLSTGDEIIEHIDINPGELKLGQVRDTNRPTLITAIEGTGFKAVDLGIAADKPGQLEDALRKGLRQVDVIITTGGVSMGELDLLKPTIEQKLGGHIHFGRVSIKPGKPTTFATLKTKDNNGNRALKVIFALPGNPASAVVTYHLFVLPSLHYTSCISPAGLPKIRVKLEQDVKLDPQRNEYHRVTIVAKSDGQLYATSTGDQRSSRIGSFKEANGLLCLPARSGVVRQGETLDALLLGPVVGDYP